jgi:hypothetical protein
MKKTGQFYLLAAIVIIAVIIGFVGVTNYAKNKGDVRVYDLKDELNIENAYVMHYGTYNSYSDTEYNALLENFTKTYSDFSGDQKNLYFVFGNKDTIYFATYSEIVSGVVSVNIGGTTTDLNIHKKEYNKTEVGTNKNVGENVIVKIENETYSFTLTSGQNFYFIISQTVSGEDYVTTN